MSNNCRQCSIACVGGETLKQYAKQFKECNNDIDSLFSSDTNDSDFYRKVIESGHVYETGYPKCICWKNNIGEQRCECSKEALIYLYSEIMPDKKIKVETIQTILGGADCCKFKIIIE